MMPIAQLLALPAQAAALSWSGGDLALGMLLAAAGGLGLGWWLARRRSGARPRPESPEAKVEELRAQMQLALESTDAGWWQWDRAADQVSWDPRVAAWFRLPPSTNEGLSGWLARVDEATRGALEKALRGAGVGGGPGHGQINLRPAGGGAPLRFSYAARGAAGEASDRIEAVVAEQPAAVELTPVSSALRGVHGGSHEGFCLLELKTPIAVWQPPEKIVQPLVERAVVAYCNEAFAAQTGARTAAALISRRLLDVLADERESLAELAHALVRTQFRVESWPTAAAGSGGKKTGFDNTLYGVLRAGQLQQIWWRRRPLGSGPEEAPGLAKRATQQRDFLLRTMRVLAQAQEKTALLQNLCRVAVEQGDFGCVWVAQNDPGGMPRPVASAGASHGWLKPPAEGVPWWRETVERALQSGEMQIVEKDGRTPRPADLAVALDAGGFTSLVAIPLHVDQTPTAVWVLQRTIVQPALAPDLGLLAEVAGWVSFALTREAHETRRDAAEEQLASLRGDYRDYLFTRTRDLRSALLRFAQTPKVEAAPPPAVFQPSEPGPLESLVELAPDLSVEVGRRLNEEEQRHLHEVQSGAGRLVMLCRNLIDRFQIESGRLQLVRESFDFAGVMNEVAGLLATAAAERGLRLQAVTEKQRLPVIGDRRRLVQVLLNLVDNAVKFTHRGEVSVRARFDGQDLAFEVSDTGAGLTSDELAAIFDELGAETSDRRRLGDPAGLGLHLCWKLVARMGGRMDAESRVGLGSTFRVWLPRRAAVEEDPAG